MNLSSILRLERVNITMSKRFIFEGSYIPKFIAGPTVELSKEVLVEVTDEELSKNATDIKVSLIEPNLGLHVFDRKEFLEFAKEIS